jgi:hypothetical protein
MAGNPSTTTNDMKASQRPRVRVVRASGDDQTERVHCTTEPRCNDEPSMKDANLTIPGGARDTHVDLAKKVELLTGELNEALERQSYSRPGPGMRGCWILRIGWLRAWHAMGSPNPSISKRPMSPSRSIGKGTTASRVPHSSSSIAIPAKPEPSWDTRRINSNTSGKAEISNIFG